MSASFRLGPDGMTYSGLSGQSVGPFVLEAHYSQISPDPHALPAQIGEGYGCVAYPDGNSVSTKMFCHGPVVSYQAFQLRQCPRF